MERSDADLVLNVDTRPLPEEVPHTLRCTSAEGSSKRDCERGDIIDPTCLGSTWTCPGTVSKLKAETNSDWVHAAAKL